MIVYNKLVRDRIPQIIEADGKRCSTRVIEGKELQNALEAKLQEELDEYLESSDPRELADMLEVILALASQSGLSAPDLERLRVNKADSNGSFQMQIFLENVFDPA
jgi:predicted house-cleaning noncanonical NTP pyrophosphatase (MazG superfamily)